MKIIHFLSPIPSFIVLLFFINFSLISSENNTEWYLNCSNSFSCGSIRDINYPFWGGNRPAECGHPALQLHCNSGEIPTIKIGNINYRILEINPETQILRITREDLFGDVCPQEFVNTTIDSQIFEFASDYVNLTIQYGCPQQLNFPVLFPHELSCSINGITYQNGYIVPGAQGSGACRASIFIPIHNSSFGLIGETSSLKQLIEGGFEVRWKLNSTDCSECKRSEGNCGFDVKANRFACLCADNQFQSPDSPTCRNVMVDEERSPAGSGTHFR